MTRTTIQRPFRVLGLVFTGSAGLLLLLGVWTFTFLETEGEVIALDHTGMMMSGGYSGIPFVHNRPSHTKSLAVTYGYRVEGHSFKGTRIGMGLAAWTLSPLGPMKWERKARRGAELTIYHANGLPSVSVLHRGIDVVSIAILALVGFALLKFSGWIQQHAHPQQGPNR